MGKKHGKGKKTLTYKDRNYESYNGYWKNDKITGIGEMIWTD